MRYHFSKPAHYANTYGITYVCAHPIYKKCTLFIIENNGLAVIQQRFSSTAKVTWWSEIDPWLTDVIYTHPNFKMIFDTIAGSNKDGLYPTITIRKLMWKLRMKPLPKQNWETTFDRYLI